MPVGSPVPTSPVQAVLGVVTVYETRQYPNAKTDNQQFPNIAGMRQLVTSLFVV